jgi:flagellum-specific peptidoglycan hydrolase FlgJ
MKKVFLIFILLLSFIFNSYSVNPKFNKDYDIISKENLWKTIKEMNIEHPEIVFAQAILETGTFSSNVFKTCNNLFGMRMPSKRLTVAKKPKKKGGYAQYDSWIQSVEDYKLFQDYVFERKGKLGKAKYFGYLDRVYCESTGYSQKLKKIIEKNKRIFNS